MRSVCLSSVLLCGIAIGGISSFPASVSAQDFSQTIFFGDSNTDSGNFKNAPGVVAVKGWGQPTTFPGPMWSTAFAGLLGTTADPSNFGGTNYAHSGATVNTVPPPIGGQPNMNVQQQISSYLAGAGGHADANALFMLQIGVNDVNGPPCNNTQSPACTAFINQATKALVDNLKQLKGAGAQYIAVQTIGGANAARRQWNGTLFSTLAAEGVEVIPIDYGAIVGHVFNNAAAYGITNFAKACAKMNAIFCRPDEFAPGAAETYLQSDGTGHIGAAVQKIVADYTYSIITAPSLISMLPERAVQERAMLVGTIQTQLPVSWQNKGALGLNAWIGGSATRLAFDNYDHFPDGDPTVFAGTVGADKIIAPGVLVGAAFTVAGGRTMEWGPRADGRDMGGFDQDETAVSLYVALKKGAFGFHAIGTYGWLDYDVNRVIPLGILDREADAETEGRNRSLALQVSYDFRAGPISHGPIAGVLLQRVNVSGFTETADVDVLAMSFGAQERTSVVSELGWRFTWDAGLFKPFGSITWNHEFEDDQRFVSAALTSSPLLALPSFSLPAINLGDDWATATIGTTIAFAPNVTGIVSGTGHFGRDNVTNGGVRVGLSAGF